MLCYFLEAKYYYAYFPKPGFAFRARDVLETESSQEKKNMHCKLSRSEWMQRNCCHRHGMPSPSTTAGTLTQHWALKCNKYASTIPPVQQFLLLLNPETFIRHHYLHPWGSGCKSARKCLTVIQWPFWGPALGYLLRVLQRTVWSLSGIQSHWAGEGFGSVWHLKTSHCCTQDREGQKNDPIAHGIMPLWSFLRERFIKMFFGWKLKGINLRSNGKQENKY